MSSGASTRTATYHQIAGLRVSEWAGTGPPVFALPGLGSSAASWAQLAHRLPDRQVLSVDLRGRGAGRGMTGPTGMRGHARDVAAILDELDLHEVIVVGHSMVAFLAPLVAQDSPDRVVKLVLVDGGIRPKALGVLGPRLTRLLFTHRLNKVDRDWPSLEAFAQNDKLDLTLADHPELRAQVMESLAQDMIGPPGRFRPALDTPRCIADAVDSFFNPDIPAALAALTIPIEVILAENQRRAGQKPFINDAAVAPWTAKLPNLTVQRIPGNHITVVFEPVVAAAATL